MSTKQEIEGAIAQLFFKLTKQQLSEILFLCQAWANGISMVSIKRQPIEIQQLDSSVKSLQLLNDDLEQRNYLLQEQLKQKSDRIDGLNFTVRATIAENRKLKHQLFMQIGVRN